MLSHEERAAKTGNRTLRLLDDEEIYNHLYVMASEHSRDSYEAHDAMRALWELLYDTVRVGFDGPDRSAQLNELRELSRTYLNTPALYSRRVRNLLIQQMFNVAYPVPKGLHVPDKLVLPGLIGLLVVMWLIPGAEALLQNLFRFGVLVLVGWWALTYWRRRLIDHLRDELSAEFNDDAVRSQLEKLDRRRHRLPSLIFALLDQKPRIFSRAQMDEYVRSVPLEQWKEGLRLKSEWHKQIYESFKIPKASNA